MKIKLCEVYLTPPNNDMCHLFYGDRFIDDDDLMIDATDDEIVLLQLHGAIRAAKSKYYKFASRVIFPELVSIVNPTCVVNRPMHLKLTVNGDTYGVFTYNTSQLVIYQLQSDGTWRMLRKQSDDDIILLNSVLSMIQKQYGYNMSSRKTKYYSFIYGEHSADIKKQSTLVSGVFV